MQGAGEEQTSEKTDPPECRPHLHVWMGGKYGTRLTKPQRRRSIAKLLELDGPYCRWRGCPRWGKSESDTPGGFGGLLMMFEVNHLGGPVEHWLDMMNLMHPDCNRKARFDPVLQEQEGKLRSMLSERGKTQKGPLADATETMHSVVSYQEGSAEMQVNDNAELPHERWLYAILKVQGSVTKYEAINVGAHEAGVSPTSTRKYYEKRVYVPSKMLGEHPELPLVESTGVVETRNSRGELEKHKVKMIKLRPGWELYFDESSGDGHWRPREAKP